MTTTMMMRRVYLAAMVLATPASAHAVGPSSRLQHAPASPAPQQQTPQGPRIGEPGGFAGPAPTIAGTYDTDFGVLVLTKIDGTYSYKNGRVTITKIYGDFMDGTWSQSVSSQQCADGTYHGTFQLRFTKDGFTGSFGYCERLPNAGVWNGKRRAN